MTSSGTETNRRGVSALSEHRRQDGWTSTPNTCGGSSGSGGCDELAGERLPKQRPHLIEGEKDEEETCPTTAKKSEEHPDRNADEHLGHDSHIRVKGQVLSCFIPAATRAK